MSATAVCLDDLVGVPWTDGGRDPRVGLDCLGLVLEVGRRQGFVILDPAGGLAAGRDALGAAEEVQDREMRVGDVLRFDASGRDHVAVVTEPGWVMQCSQPWGVVRFRAWVVAASVRSVYRWRRRA